MKFSAIDHQMMVKAIQLARLGRFTTSPNPNVGCVIVQSEHVVGAGWHQQAGSPHAEVHALKDAGERTIGATVYVTLEPCSHFGRTPPCANALIDAGVDRVVVAMQDPNPDVHGKGIERLRKAGIQVDVGLLEEEARLLNQPFLFRMAQQRPMVTVKLATSLDGKVALSNGKSQWITGLDARKDVQVHRAMACGILSTAQTVIADDAMLTVRSEALPTGLYPQALDVRQPVRVIIDTQHRLTPDLRLFQTESPILIVRTRLENQIDWPHFVEEVLIEEKDGHVDLQALMKTLSARQLNHLWVESGAALAGALFASKLVDQFILYQAPVILGDHAQDMIQLPELTDLATCLRFSVQTRQMVGQDLKIEAEPIYVHRDH
ncbi:bifunctional diaminohydroxyphosphoribosylaminopyrimidine deaminase/5-amino-6-(5-phosphoribosylamino)uracil reductase RibD [Algicola sagamiensis]|uniref:bifunctional diaminohydroxyphosphoribosylaminopyrimidine deaminase/5-amino-6-(5-phosphoribosylamino)uracil reductase RibD n=1 Tax=Algicola sagamiensis TaxID=163869 RepID=UPI0003808366|nr:bifunctional diaminohydroxyphosphoribosylaminopyrimidine deaminase/5-amino-6-(5-phosphoribosylamino)uracil reductase RibD [Algicola sagamiensis]